MAESNEPGIADRLLAQLAQDTLSRIRAAETVTHPGERGRAREVILADFLRAIIPPGFAVGTGFIIDAQGGQSRQQDIVVYRREYHPVFSIGGVDYFPVEAVAIAAEVKSTLDSRGLESALENGRSVKALDRSGGGKNYIVVGGAGGPRGPEVDRENGRHQAMTIILAGSAGRGGDAVVEQVWHYLATHPRTLWPNLITVGGDFLLGYAEPENLYGDPMTSTGSAFMTPKFSETEPLVFLSHMLLSALRVAELIDYKPNGYIRTELAGTVRPFPDDFGTLSTPSEP